jgi:hypothetical protein
VTSLEALFKYGLVVSKFLLKKFYFSLKENVFFWNCNISIYPKLLEFSTYLQII